MKKAKIQSKLNTIFKAILSKDLRKHLKYANIVFETSDGAIPSTYDGKSNTITISRLSSADIFHNISEVFKVTPHSDSKFYQPFTRDSLVKLIGKLLNENKGVPNSFLYDDGEGSVSVVYDPNVENFNFNTSGMHVGERKFWKAFDKWYMESKPFLLKKVKKSKGKKNKTPQLSDAPATQLPQ